MTVTTTKYLVNLEKAKDAITISVVFGRKRKLSEIFDDYYSNKC